MKKKTMIAFSLLMLISCATQAKHWVDGHYNRRGDYVSGHWITNQQWRQRQEIRRDKREIRRDRRQLRRDRARRNRRWLAHELDRLLWGGR